MAQAAETAYITSEAAGAIVGIDASSLQVVRQIDVGHRPHNIEVTANGLLAIATQGTDAVSAVDPAAAPVTVRRIPIGVPPHDLAVRADGRTAFVVSERGLLARLDLDTGRLLQRTELEGRPHNIVLWRKAAWITDVSDRRLIVVDDEGVRNVPISVEGHDLAVRPGSGELWVTPWSSNRMVLVDLDAQREVAEIRVGQTPSHKHLAFTADGREAWITEPESGNLFVVDTQTKAVIDEVNLRGHPHHVRFAAGRAYVAVGPRDLVVLNVRTRSIIGRVSVGSEVHDIALHPAPDGGEPN